MDNQSKIILICVIAVIIAVAAFFLSKMIKDVTILTPTAKQTDLQTIANNQAAEQTRLTTLNNIKSYLKNATNQAGTVIG